MDLWSILLPVAAAALGYLAKHFNIKVPGMPATPPATPAPGPVDPNVPAPVTPAPAVPNIVDVVKDLLPALVAAAIAEVLKRFNIKPPAAEDVRFEVKMGQPEEPAK